VIVPTTEARDGVAPERVDAVLRIITAAAAVHAGRVTLSCSFGGPSGMVLLDLVQRVDPAIPVFVLDTELLFPEADALIERVGARYGIHVERVRPLRSVAEQAADDGAELWLRDPNRCCALRKVEPLRRHLQNYDAWFTAIRRGQAATRVNTSALAFDDTNQVVKIAPLADWDDDDVWAYVAAHDLLVNTLHFDGYPSLGCIPCTQRPGPGADARAGRWAGFTKIECGIHDGG
jgi:phosphoadenosine phosphosulfate reductase